MDKLWCPKCRLPYISRSGHLSLMTGPNMSAIGRYCIGEPSAPVEPLMVEPLMEDPLEKDKIIISHSNNRFLDLLSFNIV